MSIICSLICKKKNGASVTGDKYPPYVGDLKSLDFVFPGCRIIHILRDGRDVVASHFLASATARGWRSDGTMPTIAELAGRWCKDIEVGEAAISLYGKRMLTIMYESLVSAPAAVGDRVCTFLGISPNEQLFAALRTARAERTWTRTLTSSEQEEFRSHPQAENALARLGYGPTPAYPGATDDPEVLLASARRLLEVGAQGEGVRGLLRVLRLRPRHPVALAGLLELPRHPASRFSAQVAVDVPELRPNMHRWIISQGLSASISASLLDLP
jgi:hypothetical protein